MNGLLTALLVVNVALFVMLAVVFIKINRWSRTIAGIYEDFKQFIAPPEEGKPSALANLTQQIADLFGTAIVTHIKMSLLGTRSGEVRGEQAENADLAINVATGANPMLGAVAQIPGVKKLLKKNPALLDAVIQQFMKSRGPGPGPVPVNNESSPVKFKY